jgi:hypothetical protein
MISMKITAYKETIYDLIKEIICFTVPTKYTFMFSFMNQTNFPMRNKAYMSRNANGPRSSPPSTPAVMKIPMDSMKTKMQSEAVIQRNTGEKFSFIVSLAFSLSSCE